VPVQTTEAYSYEYSQIFYVFPGNSGHYQVKERFVGFYQR
jgi:hypothetical protein